VALSESHRRNAARFDRWNALKRRDRHGRMKRRAFGATPLGAEVLGELIGPLADFLAGKPFPPPDELNRRFGQLPGDPFQAIALAILAPLVENILRGWKNIDDPLSEAGAAEAMGKYLCDWLDLEERRCSPSKVDRWLFKQVRRGRKPAWQLFKSEWSPSECVAAGSWMLDCAGACRFCFTTDERGFPAFTPEWQDRIADLRGELLRRNPVMMPHLTPPPDWSGWWAHYEDQLRHPFVRDWRKETRQNIEAAFAVESFPHAAAVSALQRVPLRLDQSLVPLVEEFAVELMGHQGEKRANDVLTVAADLQEIRWIGDRVFYLTYNCDKRGRVFPIPRLHYQREDHIRGLLRFDNGLPLGNRGRDLEWLEIHCANCEGSTDKESWLERLKWTKTHRGLIERVAADPQNNFDDWRNADKPFAFVAACRELSAAWQNPTQFVTYLPTSFDGSCNGLQHLALLARDEEAGKLVNLVGSDAPQDVYGVVADEVMLALKTDNRDQALAWREILEPLEPDAKRLRKLFKSPVMTYAYSVTDDGMADKIIEGYEEVFKGAKWLPRRGAALFLAKLVREACDRVLPGPARVMRYIQSLAEHCTERDRILEWRTVTGFPVGNRYHYPNIELVDLTVDGVRARREVADGVTSKIKAQKVRDSSSPNFVHSLDAAHLARVVLAANENDIKDILTVHDSFACLAPHARRFHQIIRREMLMLYCWYDPLDNLRLCNTDGPSSPVGRGTLDPFGLQDEENYSFH
jgi:DNA-dependent RNA polymerase